MFDFLDMIGTYEDRKVDRFESDLFTIDTAAVTDRDSVYETAIAHKDFRGGEWIILGWRDTKEEAQKYHDEMVAYYTCHGETVQKIEDVYEHVMYTRKEIYQKGESVMADFEFQKNDVVQFNESHKWCGCLGIITKVKETDNDTLYTIGVPIPQQGIAYIRVLDSRDEIEYIGHAVLTESEDEE